jgi:hypothetical protein
MRSEPYRQIRTQVENSWGGKVLLALVIQQTKSYMTRDPRQLRNEEPFRTVTQSSRRKLRLVTVRMISYSTCMQLGQLATYLERTI